MRKLDTCDFCDDAPNGVYEVVPEDVPAETRRLVLCADCRETLGTVVSPLLSELDRKSESENESSTELSSSAESRVDAPRERAVTDAESHSESEPEPAEPELSVEMPESADEGDESETEGDAEDASESADDERPERPEGYAKVVRLLRNRPAAMSRADLVELASNAYDLDEATVGEAVDAAVENGHVVETPDGLQT